MRKGFAYLPVLIIVGLIVLAGFFIVKNRQIPKPQQGLAPVVENKTEDHFEDTPEDWPTLTNHPYRFSFQYDPSFGPPPPDSMPAPPPPSGTYILKRIAVENAVPPFESCDFGVLSFKGTDWFDLEMQDLKSSSEYKNSTTTVGGVSAEKFTYDQIGANISDSYYFSNGPFAYRIGYTYTKNGQNTKYCRDTFDKIVKSFKFLETPDFVEEGYLQGSSRQGFKLLYEEPGQPALTTKIKFGTESQCNLGTGPGVCDTTKMNEGDHVEVWGFKDSDSVTLIWMGKIFN